MATDMSNDLPYRLSQVIELHDSMDSLVSYSTAARQETSQVPAKTICQHLDRVFRLLVLLDLRESDAFANAGLGDLSSRLAARSDDGTSMLDTQSAEELRAALEELWQVLYNESERYLVFPAGLMRPPARFSPPLVTPPVPPVVEHLLQEADRCWLVGFHYGATLLTLVATEQVTKYYYEQVFDEKPEEKWTWNIVVGELARKDASSPKGLANRLKKLIKDDRNQIMHHGPTLSIADSLRICVICSGVSAEMLRDLLSRGCVSEPPTDEEVETIKRLVESRSGEIRPERLIQYLRGHSSEAAVEGIPGYGLFAGRSAQDVQFKTDWCVSHRYLVQNDDLTLTVRLQRQSD